MSSRPGQMSKAPGVVYAIVTGILVLLVGTLALNASQPPPPRVAEFAPQAVEQITESFDEQSAGSPPRRDRPDVAGGAQGLDGDTGGPDAVSTPPPEIPRNKYCIGPRQTEDPQSPPCRLGWQGDNGGETSFGVHREEIVIAWPETLEKHGDTERLAEHFNLRYEFYGRKMRLERYGPVGGVFGGDQPEQMEQSAIHVHEKIKAFASLAYPPKAGVDYHYYDALAERGIVGIDSHATMSQESHYRSRAPFEWNYLPSFDYMMRVYGEFICKSLAGRPPRHGGLGISDSPDPRTFGIVYHRAPEGSVPDIGVLLAAVRGCGLRPPAFEITTGDQTILRLVDAGVTTVVCLCQGGHYFDELMPSATNQAYFPEWLVNSYHYLDYDGVGQEFPPEHAEHAFGITFHNKWLPAKDMHWYQAIKDADPSYETGDDGYASAAYERYYELLVLASGIQMAGPNLTPQTFHDGLVKAGFPAPGSGQAPTWPPGGDFGPSDHTMVEDATMIWWSETGPSYTTNVRRGTFCYIDHGKRYGLGQWPEGDPGFFEGDCK